MKMLLFTCFSILILFNSGSARAYSVLEMHDSCVSLANDTRVLGDGRIIVDQMSGADKCLGAFLVVQKVSTLVYEEDGRYRRMFNVCTPEYSTLLQLVKVYVSYVDDNPRKLHEDFFFVALDALREAFPC